MILIHNTHRYGILYFRIGTVKAGWNSEQIRKLFQNRFAHDIITRGEAKWFDVLEIPTKWYWEFGSGSGDTSY